MFLKSLNKVVWELNEGKCFVIGGIDGVLIVFEVVGGFGGKEGFKNEDWINVKKLVN